MSWPSAAPRVRGWPLAATLVTAATVAAVVGGLRPGGYNQVITNELYHRSRVAPGVVLVTGPVSPSR